MNVCVCVAGGVIMKHFFIKRIVAQWGGLYNSNFSISGSSVNMAKTVHNPS